MVGSWWSLQKALCEKQRAAVPRGKPIAGEALQAELNGSFCARAREAKGLMSLAAADIVSFRRCRFKESAELSRAERCEEGMMMSETRRSRQAMDGR